MHARRILVQGPEGEPLWVRLYVHPIGDRWRIWLNTLTQRITVGSPFRLWAWGILHQSPPLPEETQQSMGTNLDKSALFAQFRQGETLAEGGNSYGDQKSP